MENKKGNFDTAIDLYNQALSFDQNAVQDMSMIQTTWSGRNKSQHDEAASYAQKIMQNRMFPGTIPSYSLQNAQSYLSSSSKAKEDRVLEASVNDESSNIEDTDTWQDSQFEKWVENLITFCDPTTTSLEESNMDYLIWHQIPSLYESCPDQRSKNNRNQPNKLTAL